MLAVAACVVTQADAAASGQGQSSYLLNNAFRNEVINSIVVLLVLFCTVIGTAWILRKKLQLTGFFLSSCFMKFVDKVIKCPTATWHVCTNLAVNLSKLTKWNYWMTLTSCKDRTKQKRQKNRFHAHKCKQVVAPRVSAEAISLLVRSRKANPSSHHDLVSVVKVEVPVIKNNVTRGHHNPARRNRIKKKPPNIIYVALILLAMLSKPLVFLNQMEGAGKNRGGKSSMIVTAEEHMSNTAEEHMTCTADGHLTTAVDMHPLEACGAPECCGVDRWPQYHPHCCSHFHDSYLPDQIADGMSVQEVFSVAWYGGESLLEERSCYVRPCPAVSIWCGKCYAVSAKKGWWHYTPATNGPKTRLRIQ